MVKSQIRLFHKGGYVKVIHCLLISFLCAEGLSCLLYHEQQANKNHGLSIARHAPPITHILFADDSLLFCKANTTSCSTIKKILDTYCRALGQLINFQKSALSILLSILEDFSSEGFK